MKKIIIKFFDKIILLLLGVSGIFYSCAKYGMPVDEFKIQGTITNSSNQPIKGIRIISDNEYGWRGDTLYTNADGKYVSNWDYGSRARLQVDDIDGEANDGEFILQEIFVQFTSADIVRKARGNKYGNKFVKTQNIKLYRVDEYDIEYGCPAAPFEP
jgi:putative lipoprotein (rSAM/lipoprotein system)